MKKTAPKDSFLKESLTEREPGLPDFIKVTKKEIDIQARIQEEMRVFELGPDAIVKAFGDPVHLGIDSEYVFDPETNQNLVLSYQYCLYGHDWIMKGVIYPKSMNRKHRRSFEKFVGNVLHQALKEHVIEEWPKMVFVYAHFLRADLPTFSDFWHHKDQVDGIRGTVASLRKGSYGVITEGKKFQPTPIALRNLDRRRIFTYVNFIDTQLLTPGRKGLDAVGEMIGLPKVELPEGHDISRMDVLLEEDQEAFEEYAIRDAEIAVRFGLEMQRFAREELDLRALPPTIGGCATGLFRKLVGNANYFNEVFGVEYQQSHIWNDKQQAVSTQKRRKQTPSAKFYSEFFKDGFHGGRNECYVMGPYGGPEQELNDFDLVGAYTTGLVDLFPLDYKNCFTSKKPKDYCGHVVGLCHVEFEFPSDTKFPCLPVRTEQYGLVFPLNGSSYCTAPEIEVALNLGARIKINHGVIIPWVKDSPRVFEEFVRWVRENRVKHPDGSLANEMIKEVGNSLYGKTAQGLKEKTGFDVRNGLSKKISPSAVTNSYFASATTGFIRATLAEILNSVPEHRTVVSATTDGLLTDATLEELKLSGPMCQRYQALCNLLDEKAGPMLVRKHRARQVLAMKTRGQLTVIPHEDEKPEKVISAKAGVKVPNKKRGRGRSKQEQNAYMQALYLNREPNDKHPNNHLISMRDQWLTESDLVEVKKDVRLSLEFDFKREPVDARMATVFCKDILGERREHLALNTVPWKGEEMMQETRALFDGWRKGNGEKPTGNCLKTLEDWYDWLDYLESHRLLKQVKGIKHTHEGSVGILRRLFLRALTKEKWGLSMEGLTQREVAEWLTDMGYPTTVDDLKNAKRQRLIKHAVPRTRKSQAFLDVLLSEFPDFVWENAFAEAPDGDMRFAA